MTAPRPRGTPAARIAWLLVPALLLVAACGNDAAQAPDAPATATNAPATATAAPVPLTTPVPAPATTTSRFLEPDVSRVLDHIEALTVEIGSRVSASAEERRAAEYIAGQLELAGFAVVIETFDVPVTDDRSAVLLPGDVELESVVAMQGAPNGSAEGPLVRSGLGRSSELAQIEATGSVLVLDRGELTFAEKALNAEAAGAVAVIVINADPEPFRGSLGDGEVAIPIVGVSRAQQAALEALVADGARATVRVDIEFVTHESQNVVARASDECDGYLGAHYDSVEAGPGANDNASGTAALIELARTHRVDGLCAIAFGSEESGLWGSRAFVEAHDVDGATFMLNLDMVGKITSPRFVATTNDRSSRELADLAAAIATELGLDIPRGAFPPFASSDHASFSAAGVPAITIHSGDDELIHRPGDDASNVSPDDLETMLAVAAAVLRAVLAE